MKKVIAILLLVLAFQKIGIAQNSDYLDSLRHELSIAANDLSRAHLMNTISFYYRAYRPDSAIFYANKALIIARNINAPEVEIGALATITLTQIFIGNDTKALQLNLETIKIAEQYPSIVIDPGLFAQSGRIYEMSGNYSQALNEFRKTKSIADSINNVFFIVHAPARMAEMFLHMNQLDSALYYGHMAEDYAQKYANNHTGIQEWRWIGPTYFPQYALGQIYFIKGNNELSLKYLREASQATTNNYFTYKSLYQMAKVYQEMDEPDSSAFYANKSLNTAMEGQLYQNIIQANMLLSEIYEKSEPPKALEYSKSALEYRDTLDNLRKNTTLEAFFDFDEQERQNEIDTAKKDFQYRLRMNAFLGSTFTLVIIAILLFRNSRQKQKAKKKVEEAYDQLKSTQSQLIQSEKMASLGELTAGIAHEIQNPLNFVNNFSEVNKELLGELNEEVSKGNIEEVKALTKDIIDNEEKIYHHGKRADAIVKGMLQHSRSSSGTKEPTDINALCDEYLRLAYHGLRAKDKSFNAKFETKFDESLEKVIIIPQDIGRVVLNLITNAFYAVAEKKKAQPDGYEPTVTVSTKREGDQILITVNDNGNGIPDAVKDKIFQPFFTTKPTGQGTGLGLSLSYDIVKAHGGELLADSEIGIGTQFKIQLPSESK